MSLQKMAINHQAVTAKVILLLIIVSLFTVCLPPKAATAFGFYDGNKIVKGMQEFDKMNTGSKVDYYEVGKYQGYVLGVFDTLWLLAKIEKSYSEAMLSTVSNSQDYTTRTPETQLLAITAKYLKDNPDKWGFAASLIVLSALFPPE